MPTFEELTGLSRLPDPATLLSGSRPGDPADTVEHWAHLARKAGYGVTVLPPRTGVEDPAYCGDVDVDGLVYRVCRGPRRRVLHAWEDDTGAWQGRFVLEEGVWAVPAPPEPGTHSCPWCTGGQPDVFRTAGRGPVDGISMVWMAEEPDGGGRSIIVQRDPDDGHTVTYEPGHGTVPAGLKKWRLRGDRLDLMIHYDRMTFLLELPETERTALVEGLTALVGGPAV